MSFINTQDKFLVIIGPSGAGKSSVVGLLQREELISVTPSWTTRPPRPEETTGAIEHVFVSQAEFEKREKRGDFLETARLFGLDYSYGLPKISKPDSGIIPTVMLRANLLPLLNKHYSNYITYQIEDDEQKVEARLQKRQATGQELGSRLKDYSQEIAAGRRLADRVFRNEGSLGSLAQLIKDGLVKDF